MNMTPGCTLALSVTTERGSNATAQTWTPPTTGAEQLMPAGVLVTKLPVPSTTWTVRSNCVAGTHWILTSRVFTPNSTWVVPTATVPVRQGVPSRSSSDATGPGGPC